MFVKNGDPKIQLLGLENSSLSKPVQPTDSSYLPLDVF